MTGNEQSGRVAHGRLDLVCGCLLAAASLYLFVHFVPTYAPGESGPGQIAPSFIPRLALAVMLVCACLVAIRGLRSTAPDTAGAGARLMFELAGWAVFSVILLLLLAHAGFMVAGSFAILCGVALTRYRRRPVVALVLAVALPVLLNRAVWELFWIELP